MEYVFRRATYTVCHFSYFYLSKILIIGEFIGIYNLTNPVQIRAIKLRKQHKIKKQPNGMVRIKPYRYTEGNKSKNSPDENKVKSYNTKR